MMVLVMELKLNNFLIGSFVPASKPKYLLEALEMALECNENCFMIYTGSPQSFARTDINEMKIKEFQKGCQENNINLNNIVVHAPYIINLCNNDPIKRKFTFDFLSKEVERVNKIGCKYLVIHPGNATNGISISEAIQNCANILNKINKINRNVVLCIETMSGKGTEIGKTFEEIKQIINLVENKSLVGVCIDTCHT
jgi:deoxyribonuclease-4